MAKLTAAQARQVTLVSRQTGLDPRVVVTLLLSGANLSNPRPLSGLQGQTPGQELVGASRATGLSLTGLFSNFEKLFGDAALGSSYMGPGTAPAVASTVGTGSASDFSSFDLTNVPGAAAGAVGAVGQGVGAAVSGTLDVFGRFQRWVTGYALRAAEVVGGFLLVLVGLYLLARQIGLQADVPAAPTIVQAVA